MQETRLIRANLDRIPEPREGRRFRLSGGVRKRKRISALRRIAATGAAAGRSCTSCHDWLPVHPRCTRPAAECRRNLSFRQAPASCRPFRTGSSATGISPRPPTLTLSDGRAISLPSRMRRSLSRRRRCPAGALTSRAELEKGRPLGNRATLK